MGKVAVKPGGLNGSLKEDTQSDSQLSLDETLNKPQNEPQNKPLDEEPELQYEWRCTCGKRVKKFGFEYTKHISDAKKSGEDHKWQLVDVDTGDVVANSIREAGVKGLISVQRKVSPKKAQGGAAGKTTPGEPIKVPYQPGRALVEKFVQYTGELDGRLLLLYELTLPMYQAAGYTPTPEEWMEDVITQFYREHAADFRFNEVISKFVEGR